jgi:hypothetical protein
VVSLEVRESMTKKFSRDATLLHSALQIQGSNDRTEAQRWCSLSILLLYVQHIVYGSILSIGPDLLGAPFNSTLGRLCQNPLYESFALAPLNKVESGKNVLLQSRRMSSTICR